VLDGFEHAEQVDVTLDRTVAVGEYQIGLTGRTSMSHRFSAATSSGGNGAGAALDFG